MAGHNGGIPHPPPPSAVLRPGALTARLLPRHANGPLRPPSVITLDQPRPGLARLRNEYIETPLPALPHHHHQQQQQSGVAGARSGGKSGSLFSKTEAALGRAHLAQVHTPHINQYTQYPAHRQNLNHLLLEPVHHDAQPHHNTQAIVSQPTKTKSRSVDECFEEAANECVGAESIICPECGRCRCGACRDGPPTTAATAWICGDSYQCSAETTLDYCTCLCCVKAIFYHCRKDSETDSREVSCADRPCSCAPHHRWMRWGCLCLLTPLLPCLLCYPPAKGCLAAGRALSARFAGSGCRCAPDTSGLTSPVGSEADEEDARRHAKRLLPDPTV